MPDLIQDTQSQSDADLDSEHRLNRLAELSDDELGKLKIAAVNLICAAGLPGAHDLDVDHYFLDDTPHEIKLTTERNWFVGERDGICCCFCHSLTRLDNPQCLRKESATKP